ncbi:MAG: NAD-dependent epimerase/dehydratase family protein [Deltaproteobacteria bacterium]|nr:NAD-dependent epimerase/dehydratase family protein [Deltaproteobacteria bacterium]
MKLLVTGASGFIASHLLPGLLAKGWYVRGAVRNEERLKLLPQRVEGTVVGDLSLKTDWSAASRGIDVIVHLAGRAHVLRDCAVEDYYSTNVGASRSLAEAAARSRVKRLVFVSSVKAMGERSLADRPWTEEDPCFPQDSYGKSKREAELALLEVAKRTPMEIVVLRPPVVYGPGVGANIYRVLRAIERGWPLPLGSVKNRRSFIFVGNFVDAMIRAMEHSRASGGTFLVSDGKDLSTPELIRAIAQAFGKPARLVPVPPVLLRLAGAVLGLSDEVERLLGSLTVDITKIHRLLGSLTVDITKIRRLLDWEPPFGMEEGLGRTVQWYKEATAQVPFASS